MDSARPAVERSRVQTWFAQRGQWTRRGIAVAAGALATAGHAPFHFVAAYVVAITILVWLLDGAAEKPDRLRRGFALGWLFGFGHFVTGFYWIAAAFDVDAAAWGPVWGIPAVLAMGGGLALFWGAGCALAMAMWRPDARRFAAFALALTAGEWLRGHLFGGLPWILPGYVWTPGEPISQLASVFGIYGLSLITLLVAAAPAAIANRHANTGLRFAPLAAAALFLGLVWGWGAQRIVNAPIQAPGASPIVRVADAGFSQAEKWTNRIDQEWRVLDAYLAVSGPAEESRAQILIWPEGAIPVVNFYTLENQAFLDAIGAGLGDRALVTGLTRRELRADGSIAHFNSAAVIDGVSGTPRLSQIYDKHRLVPFGEFIPLWSVIAPLNIAPLQRIGSGFEPGAAPVRMVVPEAPSAVVLICYEAIFSGIVPRGDDRPGWIISVTNDAWFGNGTGPWQHYVAARYRAIEEGLPMARAASGGISAIIDSYGRAVSETRRAGGYAEAQLPPALPPTSLARWGFFLIPLLAAVIAVLWLWPVRHARGSGR